MSLIISQHRREYLKQKEQKRQKKAKDAAAADYFRLLHNASRALKRSPLNIEHLSPERQVALLQDYVAQLESDIREFEALYPDKSGRSAAIVIKRERSRALDAIARLKIGIARGDKRPRVKR